VRPGSCGDPIGLARLQSGAVTAPLPLLVLYSRPGCHLCEDAHATLAVILADRAARGLPTPGLEIRNIETDEEWHRRYAFTIPVVALGERELELATSPSKLRGLLIEVLDAPEAAGSPA
jgi:hypothetical protein